MARILVVDDADVIREKLKLLLTKADHEIVAEASNGLQASVLYNRVKPDIVTMDLTMPGVDGIEGMRRIREIDPQAVIVVVSAMGQKEIILEALDAGASGFILKPFEKEKILSVINTLAERLNIQKKQENSAQIQRELNQVRQHNRQLDRRLNSIRK